MSRTTRLVTREYVEMMARYNAWQNNILRGTFEKMDEEPLRQDRGAFFGSLLGTANHLLWADLMWLSRFERTTSPGVGLRDSAGLCATTAEWDSLRGRTDDRISAWAQSLQDEALTGDLSWYSGMLGRDLTAPLAFCIMHFFNHQTHHRGQIHAMLTAAGQATEDTDLIVLPGVL